MPFAETGPLYIGDAVTVTADSRAKKGVVAGIAGKIIEPEDHVRILAGFVRHPELGEGCAVSDYFCDGALGIRQRVLINFGAVRQFAE